MDNVDNICSLPGQILVLLVEHVAGPVFLIFPALRISFEQLRPALYAFMLLVTIEFERKSAPLIGTANVLVIFNFKERLINCAHKGMGHLPLIFWCL